MRSRRSCKEAVSKGRPGSAGEHGQRMFDGLHAADATAAGTGQAALALAKHCQTAVGDGDIEHDAVLGRGALDIVYIMVAPMIPRQTETDGEIVEIVRVAIMTAWLMPLMLTDTATSSTSSSRLGNRELKGIMRDAYKLYSGLKFR